MTYDIGPILEHFGVEYDAGKTSNQKVNCPNPEHPDVQASASVSLDEGLVNCFGCGLRGDAITLLMELEGLEFREAKRRAEELAGEVRPSVSRGSGPGDGFLPRSAGSRPGRRAWKSPWARRRP